MKVEKRLNWQDARLLWKHQAGRTQPLLVSSISSSPEPRVPRPNSPKRSSWNYRRLASVSPFSSPESTR